MDKLEAIIQTIKADNGSKPKSTVKRLKPILKAFNSYSTTAEQLPPPTLIPICLFSLPQLFKTLTELTPGQFLTEEPENQGIKVTLQSYLRGLLRLLGECEEEIRHVVVQSMSQSMELVVAFPALCRKWIRALVTAWANCSQNLNLGLRCFVCFQKLVQGGSEELCLWALRRVYVGYFQHCNQVSWRTLQHINFMGNCFTELCLLVPQKAYYVLFGYVRALAIQVVSLNTLKGKAKKEIVAKLYSQQTLQILRLLTQAIGKGPQALSGLAYPLAELINAFQKISESPEYLPLKLHLLQLQLQLMEQTEVYLPHVPETALKILGSGPLNRKLSRKAGVEGSIELGYKLSHEELKNTHIVNDIFEKTIFHLHWFSNLVSKMPAAPEILKHIAKLLTSVELGFAGHRKALKQLARVIQEDANNIESARSSRKMALTDKKVPKFERFLASGELPLSIRDKYQELVTERDRMFKAKVVAEQDEPEEEQEGSVLEEDEQAESGWEQASEGASEFEVSQAPDSDSQKGEEDMDSISYEGDPQDADEAAQQWSQAEWSSQSELNQ